VVVAGKGSGMKEESASPAVPLVDRVGEGAVGEVRVSASARLPAGRFGAGSGHPTSPSPPQRAACACGARVWFGVGGPEAAVVASGERAGAGSILEPGRVCPPLGRLWVGKAGVWAVVGRYVRCGVRCGTGRGY
jgi:hypothetical protein